MSTPPIAPASAPASLVPAACFVRRLPLRIAVIAICVIWSLPTLGLLVSSFRPAQDITRPAGGRHCSTRSDDQWTLKNYDQVLGSEGMAQRVPQQPHRDHPVDRHPHHHGRIRGLRLRLDPLPAARGTLFIIVVGLLVVPLQMSLIPVLRAVRVLGITAASWASGWRTPRSACRWRSSCSTTSSRSCRSICSRRRTHRRRHALPDVPAHRPAALGPGPRGIRHLPVPVGLERPARGPRVPGRRDRSSPS